MADSPLRQLYLQLIKQAQPVAQNRHYKYPIYDIGPYDLPYHPAMGWYNPAKDNIPAGVVIDSKQSPLSVSNFKDSPDSDIMLQLGNQNNGAATLSHEMVHHMQTADITDEMTKARDISQMPSGLIRDAYEKLRSNLYGNTGMEAQAYMLTDTLSPGLVDRKDGAGDFSYTPNIFQGDWLGGKSNILDRNVIQKLQKYFYDKLPERHQNILKPRQIP